MARGGCYFQRPVARFVSRSMAVILLIVAAGGFVAVRYWTDPVTVRRLVLEQLRRQFPGAEVSVDSARLWPGWGIQLTNLTLARKDDPTLTPVLQVPSGRIEHDGDALAQGKLRVRRLKLERPRINAERNSEGHWNLDGLIAPPRPGVPLPIIVVERGSVIIRVAAPAGGESLWEVNGLRASLMEEPERPARFEGRACVNKLGRVAVEGVWRRDRGHVDASVDWSDLPLSETLLREFGRFAPLPLEQIRTVAGTARVQVDIQRRPDEASGWQPDWRLTLANGRLGLRDLPIDFDDIAIQARFRDGRLTVNQVSARAAGAPVSATLAARWPVDEPAEAIEAAAVSVEGLLITPELFARLPEAAKRFQQQFAPVGKMSFVYQFARRTGGGWDARLESKPLELAARYYKFPYPMRKVRGRVVSDYAPDQPDRHAVDLNIEINEGARVCLRGTVQGPAPFPAVDLWLCGDGDQPARDVPVDEDLIAALPIKFQPLTRSFHFRGKMDVLARIHHGEGMPNGHDQYHLRSRNAAVCYDAFPVPLEGVATDLEIHLGPGLPGDPNKGDYWVLRQGTGSHGSGAVTVSAWNALTPHGQLLTIDLNGVRVPLTESVKAAVAKYRLDSAWNELSPRGEIDFSGRVTLNDRADGTKEPNIALTVRGVQIKPRFFPFTMSDLTAKFHATEKRVVLGECSARHGGAILKMAGGEIRTDAGLWVDMRDVTAGPLTPDDQFVAALPPTLQRAALTMRPRGQYGVNLQRLVFHDPKAIPESPVLYWDGNMAVTDASWTAGVGWNDVAGNIACRGATKGNRLDWLQGHAAFDAATVLHQPIKKVHAQLEVEQDTPDVLQVRGIHGGMFGGTLTGEGRVAFGGGLDYALDLKALGIQLEEFGNLNGIGGRLEGRATAQLYLNGRGGGVDEMTGRADVDVPSGKLYDLPLVLELLKTISLRLPDGVAFDEAHAAVKIEGRRLKVERLDLLGNAISLGGRGALNIDGSGVDLDFYAVWARIAQVLPAAWRDVPSSISSQILKIKMNGSLVEPRFVPEPVPFIIEPVQRLLDRTRGKPTTPAGR